MAEQEKPVFQIQRIYVKDLSLEAPHTPAIFREDWRPEVKIDLDTAHQDLGEDIYEVVLHLNVSVKIGDKTAFLVETKQAGIFTLKGFPADHLDHAIGSMCPNILFPFARETVSETVTRGGFPQLLLAPVNFEALYMQKRAQEKSGEKSTS